MTPPPTTPAPRATRALCGLLPAAGALVVVTGLWSVSAAPWTDAVTAWGPAAVVVGAGCALVGCLAVYARTGVRSAALLLLSAASLLLVAPTLSVGVNPRLGDTVVSAGAAVLAVALATVVPTRRSQLARRVALLLLALSGTAAVAAVATGTAPAAAGALLSGSLVLLVTGWAQFEATTGVERRQLLWLVLGVCSAGSVVTLFMFAAATVPADPGVVSAVSAVLCLPVPATVGIALLAPDRWDVRSVTSRAVLSGVMLAVSVSTFALAYAVLRSVLPRQPSPGLLGVVAALVAALHQPVLVLARTTIDQVLFGGRADLVPTLTRLGDQLSTATAPAEWLESLRTALAVPGLALQDGEGPWVTAGEVGAETTSVPLRVGEATVGELLVAVPHDHLRLPAATCDVLHLVATPLAQAIQAVRLSEQLQRSRTQVVGVLEEERRRVRRDLHDGLGPTLTGVAYTADAAANLLHSSPDEATAHLRELRADVGEAISEIRRIVYGLRPKALDELGLVAAVRQQTGRLLARDGRPFHVDVDATDLPDLPAAVEVTAYRVAVEAVTNVARHAQVARATVSFSVDHEAVPAVLQVLVTDPGRTSAPWSEGVGIASMRERVDQVGGSLTVAGTDSGGLVRARLPLPRGPAPARPGEPPGT